MARVSNKFPYCKLHCFEESSFPTGDSDYWQNIWGLVRDPLTGEERFLEQRGKRTGNSTSAQAGLEKSSVNPRPC